MVIGVTGVMCASKGNTIWMIKSLANEKYIYLDVDYIIPQFLKKGGHAYNQLIEELGPTIAGSEGDIYFHPLRRRFFNDGELWEKFMRIMKPYVCSYICQIKAEHPHKIIFLVSAYLFKFGYADICERIICVESKSRNRYWRARYKKNCTRVKYRELLARNDSAEFIKEHSDYVLHSDDRAVLKKECKQMLKELHQYRKFVEMGLIPK